MKFLVLILLMCACPCLAQEPAAQTPTFFDRVMGLRDSGKFAQAQTLLETQLAKTTDKDERDQMQIALADVNLNWANALGKTGDFQSAIAHYLKAYEIDKVVNLPYAGIDLNGAGGAYLQMGRNQDALSYFEQALPFVREAKNRKGEASLLLNIGTVNSNLMRHQEAVRAFEQALPILHALKDREGEEMTLHNIGYSYFQLGRYEDAARFDAQVLPLARALQDRAGEAGTLGNLGETYAKLGRNEDAVRAFEQALPLSRELNDRQSEGAALSNLGAVYLRLSRYDDALHIFQQALPISRELNDRTGETNVLFNIGNAYLRLNRNQDALQTFEQILPIYRAAQDKEREAGALNSIGYAYLNLRRNQEAVDVFEQALSRVRALKDRQREATMLCNIGAAYLGLGRTQQALDYLEQALPIQREISDPEGESATLNQIGGAYIDLGRPQDALLQLQRALPLERATKNRQGQANTLDHVMRVQQTLDQPRAAIIAGKQAVNLLQAIRGEIRTLDKTSQRAFLAGNKGTYQTLALLLIQQNRLEEAEQVLRFLRLEDAFEFAGRDPQLAAQLTSLLQPLSFTPEEKALLPADADVTIGEGAPESRLWQAELQKLEAEGAGRAALISTFNAKDGFWVVASSATKRVSFAVQIQQTEFDDLSGRLQKELSNPTLDPREDAHKMEQIVFCEGQLEKFLQDEKIDVALWFTSGSLRYIPIDALYDGQQYLLQKPRVNVNVTLDSRQLFEGDAPDATAAGTTLAVGVSQAHVVPAAVAGEATVSFAALPNVPREVRSIVNDPADGGTGPFDGKILLDGDFTAASLRQSLSAGVKTVHIATHFALGGGDGSGSFLLTGDGQELPISQWKDTLQLKGVELLTLSACQTGVGRDDATGAEVSSIGEISQWLGARSVLVSLWPVSDPTTATLMSDFYRRWKAAPQNGKIEALRVAQRALLGASDTAATVDTHRQPIREDDGDGIAPTFTPDPQHPFAHPFYWAPFTLIGKWH